MGFKAFWVEKSDAGFERSIVERQIDDLPDGEVLIHVQYSSLNYKDALSATGNPGVTRQFPHTPGIDAAGVVVESSDGQFSAGDEVIVIGFDLGMNTHGGFAERIRVPSAWVVPMPAGLDSHTSMIIGTAGFTAAACVQKLEANGATPDSGPVLVTGATGGVGSVAVKLLASQGYEVAAVTGKVEQHDFLKELGASEILSREDAHAGTDKALLAPRWGGVVDTVGGDILFNAVKSLRYGASVAACGLVGGPAFSATVLPFILRNVNLLGVDSVELPLAQKAAIWQRLGAAWKLDLSALEEALSFDSLSGAIDRILAGDMVGRGVIHL
jgi:acrylyl-CoA reductase (NADPH)